MCRTGGRRCPGCGSPTGRAAHNARRRHNRAIRRQVAQWARAAGEPAEVVHALSAGPPVEAKHWAAEHGMPSAVLRHDVSATNPGQRAQLAPEEEWWSVALIGQVAAAIGLQGHDAVERRLLDEPILGQVGAGGGTNETRLLQLATTRAYAKPFVGVNDRVAANFGQSSRQQPLHEVAAWRLATFLGPPWDRLVPPCVLRPVDGDLAAVSLERAGHLSGMKLDPVTGQVLNRFEPDPDQVTAAAVFDVLIGQQDRHPGNCLVDENRGLTLIDHGFAFARPGDLYNWSIFHALRWRAGLSAESRTALRRLIDDPATGGLDGVLQASRLAALRDRATRMLADDMIIDSDLDPDAQSAYGTRSSSW